MLIFYSIMQDWVNISKISGSKVFKWSINSYTTQLLPRTLWVLKPSLAQWENLTKMPLSTRHKAHYWDKPKHNCRIKETVRSWLNICLDFVCRGLVIQAKTRSNKFGAPLYWQNILNSVGLYTSKPFSWPAYCKYAFCTFFTTSIISSP